MIYVSREQLDQVEYLIEQSIRGNHVLFERGEVRRVFLEGAGPANSNPDESGYPVEHHIERLIALPTLAQKRAYLERLDQAEYERVVRTYFNIVENNLFESNGAKH